MLQLITTGMLTTAVVPLSKAPTPRCLRDAEEIFCFTLNPQKRQQNNTRKNPKSRNPGGNKRTVNLRNFKYRFNKKEQKHEAVKEKSDGW